MRLEQVNNKKIEKILLRAILSIFEDTLAPILAVRILVIETRKTMA
tara:strand:+ start:402 stop:539 length:138 start_codon:yes stop_codon:yes gene_type:complete